MLNKIGSALLIIETTYNVVFFVNMPERCILLDFKTSWLISFSSLGMNFETIIMAIIKIAICKMGHDIKTPEVKPNNSVAIGTASAPINKRK